MTYLGEHFAKVDCGLGGKYDAFPHLLDIPAITYAKKNQALKIICLFCSFFQIYKQFYYRPC